MFKKFLIFSVFLIFMLCGSVVSASEIVPLKYAGFSDNYYASMSYAIETSDGGMVGIAKVGGTEFGLNHNGYSYVDALVKLDSNLEVEWVYSLKSSAYSFEDIIEDENKNYILVGSDIIWGTYYTYYKSAFLFINSNGEKVKEVELKSTIPSLELDSLIYDGEYYYSVGTQMNTTLLSEDSNYYYTKTDVEYGLYKIDSDFNVVWFRKIDDYNYERTYNKGSSAGASTSSRESFIDFTPDGNIVFSYNYKNNISVKIYKYDKNGNQIFKKDLGGKVFDSTFDSDTVTSLVATKDNGVVVVGSIESMNTIERLGSSDAFYLKLDKEGNIVWLKYLIGSGSDSMLGVSRYNDDFVMIGRTSTTLENSDLTGSFMMIINDSGEMLMSRSIDDDLTGFYYSEPLFVSDSKIYLTGYADSDYSHYSNVTKRTNAIVRYSVKYDINVKDETGKISLSVPENAYAGDVVNIIVDIEDGYVFKGIENIELVAIDGTTYSFIMPSADIELLPIIEEKVEDVIDNTSVEKEEIKNPNTSDLGMAALVFISVLVVVITYINYIKLKQLS